tara:strand:- start:42 stop:344 length:303 start_codon:yes stop_codon:yes gene_type:complete
MIEGLKVIIPGAKVAALADARAAHHKAKVKQYTDAKASVATAVGSTRAGSYDPEGQMESKAQEHESQAAYFSLMAEHIVKDQDYLLDKSEIAHLLGSTRY